MAQKNHTVMITGATSGIGFEFAKNFARKGYGLILVGRSGDKLKAAKEALQKESEADIEINIIESDLSKMEAAEDVFECCRNRKLPIDILINNAGIGIFGEHVDLQISDLQRMIILNCITLTNLCVIFGREMKKNRYGYILNIASTAAYHCVPYVASYAATKAYVLNFSEALAKELEDFGVVVKCFSPGKTETDFYKKSGIPHLKRGAMPEDVAAYGVKVLFSNKLSAVFDINNKIAVFMLRFIPRNIIAALSKRSL